MPVCARTNPPSTPRARERAPGLGVLRSRGHSHLYPIRCTATAVSRGARIVRKRQRHRLAKRWRKSGKGVTLWSDRRNPASMDPRRAIPWRAAHLGLRKRPLRMALASLACPLVLPLWGILGLLRGILAALAGHMGRACWPPSRATVGAGKHGANRRGACLNLCRFCRVGADRAVFLVRRAPVQVLRGLRQGGQGQAPAVRASKLL